MSRFSSRGRAWLFPVLGLVLAGFLSLEIKAAGVPLFDGKTFAGWEGDTATVWQIDNGEIVAGYKLFVMCGITPLLSAND